jgi:hypothetical protein
MQFAHTPTASTINAVLRHVKGQPERAADALRSYFGPQPTTKVAALPIYQGTTNREKSLKQQTQPQAGELKAPPAYLAARVLQTTTDCANLLS